LPKLFRGTLPLTRTSRAAVLVRQRSRGVARAHPLSALLRSKSDGALGAAPLPLALDVAAAEISRAQHGVLYLDD
jgi:hypothetical protein